MANTKITELSADTSPTSDDLIPTVTDPAGTPASRKVTLQNAITKAHGLSDGIIKVASGAMTNATANTDYYSPKAKLDATTAPGVSNDNTEGYAVGSVWVDVTGNKSYIAVDVSTGAAEWNDLTASSAGGITDVVQDLTPQLGGDLDMNGKNITAGAASVSPTELGYVDGVTSAIQNQIDSKLSTTQYADIQRQGFTNLTETSIGFDGTNTFTLTSVGASWTYYRAGVKYTVSGNKTVTLSATPPADAAHYHIYIDANDGTLTCSAIDWTLLDNKVPVASLYWDNSLTPKYWLVDERHTILIDSRMQYYLHATGGAKAISIPTLTGYTPNSDVNTSKTFEISAGTLLDQDLKIDLAKVDDPNGTDTNYVVWYRTGASTWVWKKSNMPFVYNVGNTNDWIQWDNAGTMTDATGGAGGSTRWLNSYLLMSNISGDSRYFFVAGRAIFTSLATATAEDVASFTWTGLDIAEAVIAYKLTWSTVTSTSQGKCRLVNVQKVNLSTTTNLSSGAGTDHNTLSNLQGGTTSEYYHLTSAEATVVANTSNTNTGDETQSTIKTKLGAATASVDGYATSTQITKLDGIEAGADVTDATNVAAAGAIMDGDYDAKGKILVGTGAGTWAALTVGDNNQILTADSAQASGVKWAAAASGGQTTYNVIIAATGGTYTTLGAYAAATPTAGDRVLVVDDTTETGNVSISVQITLDGAGTGATIGMSSYTLTLSGAGNKVNNLDISLTTGYVAIGGNRSQYNNISINATSINTTGHLLTSGDYCKFDGIDMYSTTTNSSQRESVIDTSNYSVFSNCRFKLPCKSATYYSIKSQGSYNQWVGNYFDIQSLTSGAYYFTTTYMTLISDNIFNGSVSMGRVIYCGGAGSVITNNQFMTGGQVGIITGQVDSIVIANNSFTGFSASNTNTIDVAGYYCSVIGNVIGLTASSTGKAITLSSGAGYGYSSVIGNKITQTNSTATGVYIASGNAQNNIEGNHFTTVGTAINDLGTANNITGNMGVPDVQEKQMRLMKNTSGGALAAGDVVVWKAVAAGDEVTTTTTAGDDKVYGVATAAINNNAYGYIQTLGKTTVLKADGTTDIAVGDFLTTFTSAGIAAKATTGDMCFAIALEAYTADNSSGVLDALLITPRLI